MSILRRAAVLLLVAACDGTSAPIAVTTTLPVGTSVVITPPSVGTTVAVTAATTTLSATALPPHDFARLQPLLEPLIAPLGFRLTRAALVSSDTYETSTTGTHLAVYVEPLEAHTADEVAAAIAPVAAAFLPFVFHEWLGLESFDVCQEPYSVEDGSVPPANSVLDVGREAALAFDWAGADLAALLAGVGPDLSLHSSAAVAASDTWVAAEAAAA